MTARRDYAAEYSRRDKPRMKRGRAETAEQAELRREKDRSRRTAHTVTVTGHHSRLVVACTSCGHLDTTTTAITATALARLQAAHRRTVGVS
jgi:hypothetical protein